MDFTIEMYLSAKERGLANAGKKASANTLKSYRNSLNAAERILQKPVSMFVNSDGSSLVSLMHDKGYSQSSINQCIAALKGLFFWATKNGLYMGDNPVEGIVTQAPNQELPDILSKDQMSELLHIVHTIADQKYYLVLSLMAYSGLRISEALSLKKEHIFEDGIIVLGKGNKENYVPVKSDLLAELEEYADSHHREPYVFYSDSFFDEGHLGTGVVYRIFKEALEIAGMAHMKITPHSLRHSFATHALEATGRIEVVQDLLRHADPKTTRRYARVSNKALSDEFSKIWD